MSALTNVGLRGRLGVRGEPKIPRIRAGKHQNPATNRRRSRTAVLDVMSGGSADV